MAYFQKKKKQTNKQTNKILSTKFHEAAVHGALLEKHVEQHVKGRRTQRQLSRYIVFGILAPCEST